MARFNVEKARAAGMTEEDIAAYLSSPQAQQDSAAVVTAPAGDGSALGGALGLGSEALNAIGGPRTLLYGGGAGAAAYAAKKLFGRGRGAPADKAKAPPNPRAASRTSSSLVKLTKADIKKHEEFRNFKPGQEVRRATYEKVKMAPAPRKENPRIVAEQEARVEATQGMKPRTRGGRIVGEKVPTRDITVEGKPAKAPAPTENPRYTGGRGASGPELARRADMLAGRPIRGTVAARIAAEQAGAPDPELWRTRGISAPRGKFAGKVPGALGLLLTLLGAQDIPGQMDEASQLYEDVLNQRRDPALRRALEPTEGL